MHYSFVHGRAIIRYNLLATLLLVAATVGAQPCTCADKFAFVKNSIEQNYSGYRDKVNDHTQARYDSLSAYYLNLAGQASGTVECHAVIYDWIGFFKDGHIQIAGDEYMALDDSTGLAMRIQKAETISLTSTRIKDLERTADREEGIYISDDSMYTVAILKTKTKLRDLAGVIVSSRNPLWQKGQVKFELLRRDKTHYRAVTYNSLHAFSLHEFSFDGHSLNNGDWLKVGSRKAKDNDGQETFAVSPVAARQLNSTTMYLQIGTFESGNAAAIDSVVRAITPQLKKLPYLIIDIRGNGGGSDFTYSPIMPWIYTGPIVQHGSDVWASKDNIAGWRQLVLGDPSIPEEDKEATRRLTREMEQHLGTFVSTGPDDTLVMDKAEPYPRKVVVLTDRRTASSGEQFVLAARQSSKVTIMGQNTRGVIDYTNMRPSAPFPCKDLILYYATTRKRHLNAGHGFDNVGIPPQIVLPTGKDWIAEAVKYLQSQ